MVSKNHTNILTSATTTTANGLKPRSFVVTSFILSRCHILKHFGQGKTLKKNNAKKLAPPWLFFSTISIFSVDGIL
jgi:hypothetical protein